MASLSLRNIQKIYPGNPPVEAVHNFSLEIADKEFLVLVGPSGCGKSTMLRMIAGLEAISNGELHIGGKLVNDVLPKDRDIAMVFQNYALYPHMTVFKNMSFSLRMRKVRKDVIRQKVGEASKILNIEHLLNRKPKALSGGERQRVALGRAIVRDPVVFLMDEPLSNLDAKLRASTRAEISKLHKRLKTTFIYVTHDQTEAMTMGERIVVMNNGLVQQVDTPQKLYDSPCNIFVASFIGTPQMNFLNATINKTENGYAAKFENTMLPILPDRIAPDVAAQYVNKEVILGIRPEDIYEEREYFDKNSAGIFDASVELVEPMGAETYLYLVYGEKSLIARTMARSSTSSGTSITMAVDCNQLHIFDKDTEIALSGRNSMSNAAEGEQV